MSQKPPLLQQVDVKNGVPGAAAINQPGPAARGSNGASSAPHNDGPAAVAGAPAAATPEIYEMLAELRRDIDARRNVEAAAQHAAPAGELHAMMSDLRRDMSVLKRSPVTIRTAGTARPIGTGAIPPSASPAVMPVLPANIVYVEAVKPSILRHLMSEEMRPALSLATALFIAVSGLYLITNRGALAPLGSQPAVSSASGSTAAVVGTVAGSGGTPLYDAMAAGSTSPQGVNAKGVTATRALARANAQLLVTGASRDTQEAAFWLKRYMSDTMGDVRMARALTQLGATFAEQTDKGADYTKARQVWEMAGALGDPVAMCFLGRLFENGWSVAANSKTALQWYERARDAGGCPAVEEAIARVQ